MFLVVDTEDAFFRDPALAFAGDEFPDSVLANEFQVLHLAHAVFGLVTPIEVLEAVAGKFGAMAAEGALAPGADAEPAVDARLGHVLLSLQAAVAGVLCPEVGFADAAVHAAGGDEALNDPLSYAFAINHRFDLARYLFTGAATVFSLMFLEMQYGLLNQSGNVFRPLDELQVPQQIARSSSFRPLFQ